MVFFYIVSDLRFLSTPPQEPLFEKKKKATGVITLLLLFLSSTTVDSGICPAQTRNCSVVEFVFAVLVVAEPS